jgi:hypothetical protein
MMMMLCGIYINKDKKINFGNGSDEKMYINKALNLYSTFHTKSSFVEDCQFLRIYTM